MRRVAIALVALLALTGCAETGSLLDKAQIDTGMQTLTSDLAELGLETTYTAELTPDYEYVVSVHATGPERTEQQLVQIASVVRAQLGSGIFASTAAAFDRTGASFDLTTPAGVVLAINDYTATDEQVAADIAFSFAVGEAYGAPSSTFFGLAGPESGSSYNCSVGMLRAVPSPDWDAIRELGGTACSLSFPGLSYEAGVPGAAVTDLVDALGELAPLMDFTTTQDSFITVDVYSDSTTVSYLVTGLDVENPVDSPSWPTAVAIARLVLASGAGPITLAYYPLNGSGYSSVGLGDCPEVLQSTETDAALAQALTAELGAVVQPGLCVHA